MDTPTLNLGQKHVKFSQYHQVDTRTRIHVGHFHPSPGNIAGQFFLGSFFSELDCTDFSDLFFCASMVAVVNTGLQLGKAGTVPPLV